MSSTDPKSESSESISQDNEVPSEEEPKVSSPSEKLGDSSTVFQDPLDSDEPKEGDAEEEEEGECGFCLFMKGGGCKESFTAWEVCIEEAEKNKEDIVTKCMEVTSMLKKCMDDHSDYYQPILAAEKAAEEQVKKEIETDLEYKKILEEEAEAKKQAQG